MPEPPDSWHRHQLEQLAQEQDRRRAEDNQIVGGAWDDLTPEQRTAFAAYYHQHHGAQGPAAYPTTVPPAQAAAAVFDQPPLAGVAEANTARHLVAQAFPRNSQKPPTITTNGQSRTTPTRAREPGREDRGR